MPKHNQADGFWVDGESAYIDGLHATLRNLQDRLAQGPSDEERKRLQVEFDKVQREYDAAQSNGGRLLF